MNRRIQRVERITEQSVESTNKSLSLAAQYIRNEIDGHGPGFSAAMLELDSAAHHLVILRDMAKAARVVET